MKARIVTTFVGSFGLDEKTNKIIVFEKFPSDPNIIAKKIVESNVGYIEEERRLEDALKKRGYKKIEKGGSDFVNKELPSIAIEKGIVKTRAEFNQLVSKINIEITKTDIKQSIGRDKVIIHVIGAIEEIDKSANILVERLREWYGLHFPEMGKIVSSNKKYADIVSKFGSRKSIEDPELSYYRDRSMGIDFKKPDSEIIQSFSDRIRELNETREEMLDYMDKLLKEVAPNTREVAGPILAAKLISLAGGLDKLARMPSSTIQLLGAEKALFRHLKGRGKSPKHGVIIMHQYIQRAPKSESGKLARLISSKISIAAKLDQYSKEYQGEKLKQDLDKKVKEALSKSDGMKRGK